MLPFTPVTQAGVQGAPTLTPQTPPLWPTAPYSVGGAYSGPYSAGSYPAPYGAAPQASWTPVSGSATVTISAGASGTVGPTVTNDTPGEPGGGPPHRPHRPPTAISHRACDVTRHRAAAEELTIAPTMLPALCMAPTFEQPYGMGPYGGAGAMYTVGGAYPAPYGAAPQASWTPVSGSATVTISAGASGTVGPTVTNDT
ncbi:MAG TPA: hypothetical protein VH640_21370, partial [Bryobacteraceae bacterium]